MKKRVTTGALATAGVLLGLVAGACDQTSPQSEKTTPRTVTPTSLATGASATAGAPVTVASAPGPSRAVGAQTASAASVPVTSSTSMAALQRAADAGKYLYVFFYRSDQDSRTRAMRAIFEETVQRIADRADSVLVDTTDPIEKPFVVKFKADRAPMPLAMAIGPTGTVTGGFPLQFDEARLLSALVSPSAEQCIKAMRSRRMVLLCVQNDRSGRAAEAMRAARELHADPKYARTTEIVTLDPSDEVEAGFLKQLGIDPRIPDAITVIIAPSGQTLNRFRGGATKQVLASAIQKAASAAQCGPNASPGCCPPKKPKPKE